MNQKIDFSSDPALLQTALGATLISFSAVWVKLANVAPDVSAFYRVFFGAIFLLTILLVHREKVWRGWTNFGLSMVAAIFFAFDLYAWHCSIGYVGPGLATILSNFQVFLVPLAGLLLYGETVHRRFVLSVPLAIFGLFLIVGVDWKRLPPDYRIGIYYGLATALFYTGFLIALRKVQSLEAKPSAAFNLLVVSVVTAFYLAGNVRINNGSFAIPDFQSGVALVALGLLSQTIGWLLITGSLPKIPAAIAGLILLLQPALSFIWDVLFFDRETSATAWGGVVLVLAAIYMGATSKSV